MRHRLRQQQRQQQEQLAEHLASQLAQHDAAPLDLLEQEQLARQLARGLTTIARGLATLARCVLARMYP